MTLFKQSVLFAASICGIIISLAMFLAWPLANMSFTSALARSASGYVSFAGLLVLLCSVFGMFMSLGSGGKGLQYSGAHLSSHAIVSVVLGFPLLGFMTWGLASIGGMILGVIALKRICSSDEVRGRGLAIAGICLSFSTFPLLTIMLLFLGP